MRALCRHACGAGTLSVTPPRAGIDVTLVQHSLAHGTPDACFPNNWFSTHGPEETSPATDVGVAVLYPMKCPNRALERRPDLQALVRGLGYDALHDMTGGEKEDVHFEGTGVLVLDRVRGTAYVALSDRANKRAAEECAPLLPRTRAPAHAASSLRSVRQARAHSDRRP